MQQIMYHFAEIDDAGVPRLRYGDGREIRVGETLTVDCEPVVCQAGLHACPRIIDTLNYAPERSALSAVRLDGTVVQGSDSDTDKFVATERTVIAMLTAAETDALLHEFARWCALSVAHLWNMPVSVRQYLETGNETFRDAAWAAAWAAARDAAGAAARDAAGAAVRAAAGAAARAAARAAAGAAVRAAAWAAARAAAWAAVRAAAWAAAVAAAGDAAWDAAGDAARAAARDAAMAAAWDAALDAAGDTARAAARDAQNEQLERMMREKLHWPDATKEETKNYE